MSGNEKDHASSLGTPWERSHRQTFVTRDFHSYGLFCCSGTHKSGFVKLHPLKLKVTILGESERVCVPAIIN